VKEWMDGVWYKKKTGIRIEEDLGRNE